MKTVATVSSIAALLLAAFFVCMPTIGRAQPAESDISFPTSARITLTELEAPRFDIPGRTSSNRGPNAEKWWMVEWSFDVTPYDTKFVDEVTFKVYMEAVEFKDATDTKGEPVVLTGEVSYMLLQAGKEQFGALFLPPQVVAKFGGERVMKNSRLNIFVEAVINGRVVAELDRVVAVGSERPGDWKTRLKNIPKYLLTKDKSPWISSGVTRYPLQKLDTPR